MSTVNLSIYTIAYPTITDRLKAVVYKRSDPLAEVASIIDSNVGHPARIWTFPGLDRTNYNFQLQQLNALGQVVDLLANFDVVPDAIAGTLVRAEEQIEADVTTGFLSGANSVTFDGTGGKADWRGWNINPERIGIGTMKRGLDYSYDITTGTFALLVNGDTFQPNEWFNIVFDAQANTTGGSVSTNNDFPIQLITTNIVLTPADFGTHLIIEPAGVYMEVTLPDLATIVAGRKLTIEIGGVGFKCVKFQTIGGQVINYLQPDRIVLFGCPNESFSIYKFVRDPLNSVYEYRIADEGSCNFKNVGETVKEYSTSDMVFNKVLRDGGGANGLNVTQFARHYNEFVLQLPPSRVVNYDDWATGNNRYLHSLANSSNPAFAGYYRIPDTRGLFERNNNTGNAGDYQLDDIKPHNHGVGLFNGKTIKGDQGYSVSNASKVIVYGATNNGSMQEFTADQWTAKTGTTETRPVNVAVNNYERI